MAPAREDTWWMEPPCRILQQRHCDRLVLHCSTAFRWTGNSGRHHTDSATLAAMNRRRRSEIGHAGHEPPRAGGRRERSDRFVTPGRRQPANDLFHCRAGRLVVEPGRGFRK